MKETPSYMIDIMYVETISLGSGITFYFPFPQAA